MLNTVQIAGHSHAVFVDGQGAPPIVFVHGFPLDHAMWRHQLAHLAKSHQVIAPDLPGFGKTPLGDTSVSIIEFADGVAKLLDALSIKERVVLCGLSMGGCVALQFALRHGNRLAGLILCDARAGADSAETLKVRHTVADRALKEGPEFIVDTIESRLISKSTAAEHPRVKQELAEAIRRCPRNGVANGSLALGGREDVTDRLGTIDVSTLIIVGEHDVISPPQEMRSIADAMPQATFVEVKGAGHMAPLEAPGVVNAAIEHFLAGLIR
jgi:pimeloyl-ACP methyl ester carboxylesterase